MSHHHIGPVGGGSGMQSTAHMGGGGGNLSNAVSGLAGQLGVNPQQLGGTLSGLMSAATSGNQGQFGQAVSSLVQMLTSAAGNQGQGCAGQGMPACGGGSPSAGPGGNCAPSSADSGAGSQGSSSLLDMVAQILQKLGMSPQMIQQIMGAVMNSMQTQGGGGAMPSDAVSGVQAA